MSLFWGTELVMCDSILLVTRSISSVWLSMAVRHLCDYSIMYLRKAQCWKVLILHLTEVQ